MLEAALGYAARGWPVFPCIPGRKAPATTHGFKDATTDPDQIRAWWTGRPGSNIGIATGEASFDVLDIDVERDASGYPALATLQQSGLLEGHGPMVRTRSGGLHVYFTGTTQRCSDARDNSPVDFKASGGYVIAPPSYVDEADDKAAGSYEWISDEGDATAVLDWRIVKHILEPPAPFQQPARQQAQGGGGELKAGDDFNDRADWADILIPRGWTLTSTQSDGTRYWRRPGKTTGMSATTGRPPYNNLYVFSRNTAITGLPPDEAITKFHAVALLDHGGDHAAARRALQLAGYGTPLPATPAASPARADAKEDSKTGVTGRKLILTPASDIAPEPVVWAWEDDDGFGRIPAGSLGLFAGREGTGKSSFLIWMTARITTGTLRGSFDGPRSVIYVAVEDSWKYTIVPRLIASGADLTKVYRAEVHILEGETVSLNLPADNKMLEEAITSHDVAMVALDPLMSAISDSLDTHVNRQVRQALDPLARLADRTGSIIAGIAHFNKSSGTDASSLITASGAFKDVARFIFGFAVDPDDGSQVITQTKNSLGLSNLPSFAYRIIEATIDTAKGAARVGKLVIDGKSERSVQDILSVKGGEDRDEKTRAEDYLKKKLGGGPQPTREVVEEAREIHAISPRTLERARVALRLQAAKRGSSWWMSLPEHEGDLRNPPEGATSLPAKTAKAAKPPSPGHVGGVGGVDLSEAANTAKDASPGGDGGLPLLGSCAACYGPCNRYGDGGSPLCDQCREGKING